jgi:hypothetical protein
VLSNEKQCKLDLAVTAALAREKDPPRGWMRATSILTSQEGRIA